MLRLTTHRLGLPGWDIVGNEDEVHRLVETLEGQGWVEVTEAAFDLARVRQGQPRFGHDFKPDSHYPQEVGLRGAVSFTKGCYVGQEVVCMLENRGRLKRKLVLLKGEASTTVQVKDAVSDGEQNAIGEVTSTASDGGTVWALAYIKAAKAQPGVEVQSGGGKLLLQQLVGESDA